MSRGLILEFHQISLAGNSSALCVIQVLKFSQQQKTLVATMRRFSVMKKESSITRDIKLQAESIHRCLDTLSKQVQRTEDQQGLTSVTARIQRSQHAALSRKFQQVGNTILLPYPPSALSIYITLLKSQLIKNHNYRLLTSFWILISHDTPEFIPSLCSDFFQVMRLYNENLLTKQDRCKHFIIRQLEVSGRDVTEDEVNEMVAAGKWEVFNENLLNDARITRSQLSEIEQRHKVRLGF